MPKIELDEIERKVVNTQYFKIDECTVCVLLLDNGFYAVGHSAPVDPLEYDEVVGKERAYNKALDTCLIGEAYHRKELDYMSFGDVNEDDDFGDLGLAEDDFFPDDE